MKSFRDRNPYAVGIVSVLLIGAATGFAFMVGLLRLLEDTYEMEARFTDASGLRSGDDVRVAGVEVGRVTKVTADETTGQVKVVWVVDSGVEIGNEAGAEVALASLLGAKFIRITGPTDGSVPMEDLPRDQRLIPVERTKVPFDIFELTRVATDGIERLNTEDLDAFINDLADITDGKAATVAELTDGIIKVGSAINDRDAELEALLDQADRLAGTLSDKDEQILALIDASQEVLDLVVERRNELAVALGAGADAVQELNRVIAENRTVLDAILDKVHPTLDVVAANQDDLDRTLARLGPAFLQQSRGGGQGPWQDVFVRGAGPDALEILQDVYGVILGGES